MPEVINFDHMYHELAGLLGTPKMARRMLVTEEVNGVNGILVKYRVNFNVEIKDAFTGYEGKLLDHVEKHIETLKLKGKSKLAQKDQLEWIQHALIEVKELSLDPHSNKQQPIGPNDQVFVGETRTPAAESALQQDGQGQSHGEGSMLSYDNLDNDEQKALYADLIRAMHEVEFYLVENTLGSHNDYDIERVLSTWVDKENGITFLTLPATRTSQKDQTNNRKKIIEAIWDKANTKVRDLWINLHTENLHDQGDIISYLTNQQRDESDTGAYNGIIQKIQEHERNQPVGASRPASPEMSATSAASPPSSEDGHSQDPETEDYLKDIIMDHSNDTKTIHTAITHAIKHGDIAKVYAILRSDNQDTLRTLLNKEATIQYADGTERKYTALSYAEIKGLTDLAKKIEQKMHELAPAHEGKSPEDFGATHFSGMNVIPGTSPPSSEDEHSQDHEEDDLYDGLIDAINANDLQKIDVILNIKNQDILKIPLSMKETITYEDGREERHTALSYAQEQRCADIAMKIEHKMRELGLEVPAQPSQPVDQSNVPFVGEGLNLGASPLPQQGWQEQLNGTGGFSLSSDHKGQYQSFPTIPPLDEGEHQSVQKTPTFWDKLSAHKGKIAAVSGIVGMLCVAGALSAGLPFGIACAAGAIGVLAVLTAIGIGIAGKMVYDNVSDKATKWGVSKPEAVGTMFKDLFSKKPNHPEYSV